MDAEKSNKDVKSIVLPGHPKDFPITYTSDMMKISYENFHINIWRTATISEIARVLPPRFEAFWEKYGKAIISELESNPAIKHAKHREERRTMSELNLPDYLDQDWRIGHWRKSRGIN